MDPNATTVLSADETLRLLDQLGVSPAPALPRRGRALLIVQPIYLASWRIDCYSRGRYTISTLS